MTDHSSRYQDNFDLDDFPSNHSKSETIGDIIASRYSRRSVIKGALATSIGASLGGLWGCSEKSEKTPSPTSVHLETKSSESTASSFDFIEIQHGRDELHHIAPDHNANILIRWGDPILSSAPEFDPFNQSAEAQEQQFGFNNDFVGFLALKPKTGQEARALLCVNHEYPKTQMMFAGMQGQWWNRLTPEQMEIEKAAIGCSVIEIYQTEGKWQLDRNSDYNRRISARSTEFEVTGPAAGHTRLQTSADPSGKRVIGTMNNCAGGMTPWGTYLSCEENVNYHFLGEVAESHPESKNHKRYGVTGGLFQWGRFDKRFNVESEPNEPNRFGWVVEIDPLDPKSTPQKRTALGRFKHEGAETVIAPDGRLVIYMGDDQRFDYLYKFVTEDQVDLEHPKNNRDILDRGTLYVAKFNEDGTLNWLPIVHGSDPLTNENGFESQADVLIETRRAADLLGATPMDRPEDVVPNKNTGKVYVMLTNNTRRQPDDLNVANPRGPNAFGHIIELIEPNGDFCSTQSTWEFLVKAGDPSKPENQAMWHRGTSENGWFASPDNGVIDPSGRLWVSTDQGEKVPLSGTNDGLWAMETEGELRGTGKMFFRCPNGAELCGPCFSDDGESLFMAVQHPGDNDEDPRNTNFDTPATRWPDFEEAMPPRPSIVAVSRKGGGKVG